MSKRLLTKLLAFTMCAGLVLQPVTAFAQEGEPQEYNIDSYYIIPSIQDVKIEDNILSWAPFEGAACYRITIARKRFAVQETSLDLAYTCAYYGIEAGTYTIKLEALDEDGYNLTLVSEIEYTNPTTIMPEVSFVSSVNATSDIAFYVACAGHSEPYIVDDKLEMEFSSTWELAALDGWKDVGPIGKFSLEPGIYRIRTYMSPNELNVARVSLSSDVTLTVDGQEWVKVGENTEKMAEFASPAFEVGGGAIVLPDVKTKVTNADVTMHPFFDVLNPRYDHPCDQWMTFTSEDPKVSATLAGWLEQREEGWVLCWPKYYLDTFYRYCVELKIAPEYQSEYELGPETTLTVDGEELTLYDIEYNEDNEIEYILFASRVYDCRKFAGEPAEKIGILSAAANSDYETIPKYGELVKDPYFETNPELPIKVDGVWVKITEDGNSWETVTEGAFTPGQYAYSLEVSITSDNVNAFMLDPDFKFYVNGEAWTKLPGADNSEIRVEFMSEVFTIEAEEPIDPVDPEDPIEEEGHWQEKYGAEYYELPDGKKATGMQKIGDDMYLFSNQGTLQKNVFFESDGNKYFFGEDGKMTKGWLDRWGATYYADENGVIQTGFVDIGDNTYYFDSKGKKTSSIWINENGNRYYIKADGRQAKSETIHRWGKEYSFDAAGALIR